ncbi:MAG: alpha/beta hydrolase [bacterium]|nr:alpha/beta hydrolase [bacterium]
MPYPQKFLAFLLMPALFFLSGGCGSEKFTPGEAIPCVTADDTAYIPGGNKYLFHRDLVWDSSTGQDLFADLYLPEKGGPFATVIHIHGGAWISGSKGMPMATYFGEHLACRGYAFFDVRYRLGPEIKFPQDIQDIKCAIRWLRGNAEQYNIDKSRFISMGGSAGGHLSAMVALTGNDHFFDPVCPGYPDESFQVQAAIPFYGVHEWVNWMDIRMFGLDHSYFNLPANATDAEKQALLVKVSPVTYAADAPGPFLIIQGDEDVGVPVHQGQALNDALVAAGKESRLVFIEGANHAFDMWRDSPFTAKATREVDDFLAEVMP